MATRFACDPEQAQQVTERLVRVGGSIAASPPSGLQKGGIGSGLIEEAMAELDDAVASAQRKLADLIDKSGKNFSDLATGAVNLDQQEAEGI